MSNQKIFNSNKIYLAMIGLSVIIILIIGHIQNIIGNSYKTDYKLM
jgi:hypothetical protein